MNEISLRQASGSTTDSGHISGRELFNDVQICMKKKNKTIICAIKPSPMNQNNKNPIRRIIGNVPSPKSRRNGKAIMSARNGVPGFVRTNTSESIRQSVNNSYIQTPKRNTAIQQRRKSIDCTYGIIRLPGNKVQRPFLLVPPKTSYSCHSDEAHEGLFPPLNTSKSTAGTNVSLKCRSNASNSDILSLRAPSPNPPGKGPQTARTFSAKSPKFGLYQTQRNDTVQYRPATNYDLNDRLTHGNVQELQKPRKSIDLAPHTYDVLHLNHAEATNTTTAKVCNAWNGKSVPKIHTTPQTPSKSQRRMRSTSVYSPSSVGSADKLSDRMNFNHRRRASLPCAIPLDTLNSPEFHKAVSDMCNTNANLTNLAPSATIPFLSNKEHTSSGLGTLHRITEEVPTEDKEHIENKTEAVSQNPTPIFPDSPNGKSRSDSAFVDGADENSTDNVIEKTSKVNLNGGLEIPVPTPADKSKTRSLFYIPEPGTPFHKVSSRLKDTVEISKNEENRHFISGMPAPISRAENNEQNDTYFKMLDGEVGDDVIDASILQISDDDLCEEDYQKKRITIWLMGVQTGDKAEQVVMSATPPPSPVPRRETAIVVVFNGDET